MYNIDSIQPSKELSEATGCTVSTLEKIVKKGEGAYYSSGSRPNQTPQSWGIARLASSITGGKSAAVDYKLLDHGCDHKKRAFILARKSRKINQFGQTKTERLLLHYNNNNNINNCY